MAKRFLTYFGVPIPPWKEDKLDAGAITIRFVITGSIPSKKNNTMAVAVRKDARKFLTDVFKAKGVISIQDAHKAVKMVYSKVRPNTKYIQFVEAQKPILIEQMKFWSDRLYESRGLVFPLKKASMKLRFYFKDRYVQDTVNKQQTIQDLLVDANVVSGDDYDVLNPIEGASACYYQEITENIALVSLTFRQ